MEKKSIFNRMWDKFKEDPVYSIWFILGLVDVVVTLVVLIRGIVNFQTTGYYIPNKTFPEDDARFYVSQNKFDFLNYLFAIQFILSVVEGLRYNRKRTVAALVTTVVWVVLWLVYDGYINVGINRHSTVFEILGMVFLLGLLYVIYKLYKGTMAGWMILITFILYELFFNGITLILNIQQYPGKAILCIIAIVVLILLIVDSFGVPVSNYGGNDYSAPSRTSYSDTRDMNKNKNQNEIDRLKRENEQLKSGIEKHNRGDIGYFHVDNKATQRTIERNEKRIKDLEK